MSQCAIGAMLFFFFSSRRRHTRCYRDWSSDVCSSDLQGPRTIMNFFILSLIKAAVVAFVLLTTLAYLQWIERKVIAHIQLRVGPRRVGPHGLLQPLADVIKLITKEDILPSHVNTVFYFLAPFIAVVFALISISVIPFGTEINIGPIH